MYEKQIHELTRIMEQVEGAADLVDIFLKAFEAHGYSAANEGLGRDELRALGQQRNLFERALNTIKPELAELDSQIIG